MEKFIEALTADLRDEQSAAEMIFKILLVENFKYISGENTWALETEFSRSESEYDYRFEYIPSNGVITVEACTVSYGTDWHSCNAVSVESILGQRLMSYVAAKQKIDIAFDELRQVNAQHIKNMLKLL